MSWPQAIFWIFFMFCFTLISLAWLATSRKNKEEE